jgi:hypothetical protein
MKITFDKGFSNKQRDVLERATRFFASALMDPRMVRTITLDLERTRTSDVMGECVSEDDTRNPRWFTISLRGKKTDEDIVKTLAHEMVHVKQYAKNELSNHMRVTKGKVSCGHKWQGDWWTPGKKEDAYFDSPWEIEAYGREVGLYHKWCEAENA